MTPCTDAPPQHTRNEEEKVRNAPFEFDTHVSPQEEIEQTRKRGHNLKVGPPNLEPMPSIIQYEEVPTVAAALFHPAPSCSLIIRSLVLLKKGNLYINGRDRRLTLMGDGQCSMNQGRNVLLVFVFERGGIG